jgi:hypothetical protein
MKVTKTVKRKITTKKTVKKMTEKDDLAKELKTLIPKLDEEGLAFLVKQAHVHLYNMQADALNQTMIRDEQRRRKTAQKSQKTTKISGFSDIKYSNVGTGCHILYNNQWISFTSSEIINMKKIANSEGADIEIKGRLYNWLARERGDLLVTASISDKFDDKLISLINLLKSC